MYKNHWSCISQYHESGTYIVKNKHLHNLHHICHISRPLVKPKHYGTVSITYIGPKKIWGILPNEIKILSVLGELKFQVPN